MFSRINIGTATGASGATLAVTVPAGGIPAGSLIVVAVTEKSTSGTSGTLADTASNTWNASQAANLAGLAANGRGMVFFAFNSKALVSGNTITYTRNLTASSCSISVSYFSGILQGANPEDTAARANATGTTGTITVTSGTPANAGDLFIGALCSSGTSTAGGSATFTQAANWSTPPNEATTGGAAGSRVNGGFIQQSGAIATAVYAPTLSSTAQQFAVFVTAFRTIPDAADSTNEDLPELRLRTAKQQTDYPNLLLSTLAAVNFPEIPAAGNLTLSGSAPGAIIGTPNYILRGPIHHKIPGTQKASVDDVVNLLPAFPVDFLKVPAAANLALAGAAPIVSTAFLDAPAAASLTLSSAAPSAVAGALEVPAAGSLALTGIAPILVQDLRDSPAAGGLALTGVAPSATVNVADTPAVASLALSTTPPVLVQDLRDSPAAGTLTLTGQVSLAGQSLFDVPAAAGLTLSGAAPSSIAALPTVFRSPIYHRRPELRPKIFAESFATPRPLLTVGGIDFPKVPAAASLTLTGPAPSLTLAVIDIPAAAALTLQANAPTLGGNLQPIPASGSLTLTGAAPSLLRTFQVAPNAGALALTGNVPSLTQSLLQTPAAASLALSGAAPSLLIALAKQPTAANLALSGNVPTAAQTFNQSRTPAVGTLAVAGAAPAIQVSGAVKPAAASLALSSAPPTLSFGANRVPASAVLALVAAPPVARRDIILRAATGSLLLSSDAPSVVRASSAEHKWLVCTSISINPEIGGEASIAAELQGLVEINATLAGKPNVKEC